MGDILDDDLKNVFKKCEMQGLIRIKVFLDNFNDPKTELQAEFKRQDMPIMKLWVEEQINKKKKKEKIEERFWNLSLLLVGFFIGLLSSWLTQNFLHNQEQLTVANYLRATIQQEITTNDSLASTIPEAIEKSEQKIFVPQNFKWQHDNSFIDIIGKDMGYLNKKIIQQYSIYLKLFKQCQSYRDMFVEALEKNNGDITKVQKINLDKYLESIQSLNVCGNKLIELINKYYPEKQDP